jgi:ribosomal protein L12E/L44/L45/RPP1/RPP2
MASVAVSQLSAVEKEQLAISYAAFVLSGTGAQVTADSLNAVLTASGVKVSAGLVGAVAKALKTRSVTEMFGSVGGSSGSAPVVESKPQQAAKVEAPKK